MATKTAFKKVLKLRRHSRARKKISGTEERPRLALFKSAKHVYAQVIDDVTGKTLLSISSFEKGKHQGANADACTELGKALGERCKAKNITKVVFDKSGNQYHGRVKSFADGAREAGLLF